MDSGEQLRQWQSSPEEFVRVASTSFQSDEAKSTPDEKAGSLPQQSAEPSVLPEVLSVLFVDDDLVIRKLFCRAIKRVVPGWKVAEASNGETA